MYLYIKDKIVCIHISDIYLGRMRCLSQRRLHWFGLHGRQGVELVCICRTCIFVTDLCSETRATNSLNSSIKVASTHHGHDMTCSYTS